MPRPLKDHLYDYIELNTDPDLPFSDVLDQLIQDAKADVLKVFADYEHLVRQRRRGDTNVYLIHPDTVTCTNVEPFHVWTESEFKLYRAHGIMPRQLCRS
jgi:hypothetical protein